ncbi:MAG: hypothetical protein ABI670_13310 [Chloroflexota bacterium]
MAHRRANIIVLLLLLPVLLIPAGTAVRPALSSAANGYAYASVDGRQFFAPTGQYVEGKFLQYWLDHGGLPIFGYPLTPAFQEGGRTVQYFERSRFELHPENAGSPYEILLGQLGKEHLIAEGRKVPGPDKLAAREGEIRFPETGYKVGGAFFDYWQAHGGLFQFGYPLSPELKESGTNLVVQYFERARFEYHPENAGTPYAVLLTLLGTERAAGLDTILRDRWADTLPAANLHTAHEHGRVPTLAPLMVSSDVAGELRLLGGDNRYYASYPVQAGVPITITVAGWRGPQSLVLYQGSTIVAAKWAAYDAIGLVWGMVSGDPVWDGLYDRIGGYLQADAVDYLAPDDTTPVHGYRSPDNVAIWLRDHVYQSKGFKFFDKEMKSALDYFRTTQRADGSLDDYLFHLGATAVYTDQVEVEADREYLFVEGVHTAWQATGDDAWLKGNIPAMERALEHLWGDTRRWDPEHGLIKRAFTIDTWDFEQGSTDKVVRRDIDDQTKWSIMHGDNTGAYHAARLLALMEHYFGRKDAANLWDTRAANLADNLNKLSWNGNFYTHQVHLTPIDPTGVDESKQLSLSNAYALNRGTLSHEQAAAIIRSYQARRAENGSRIFAEWYSIDPPFRYGFSTPGEYVNGGIMPLVGGELALGAFDNGFEAYGVDILRRYNVLLDAGHGAFLWYYPDGRPGISTDETTSTDGWGSAAMLNALVEGLAGVVDSSKQYRDVTLAPRWAATDRKVVSAALHYEATGAYFAYNLRFHDDSTITLAWGGKRTEHVRLHLLLPANVSPRQASLNGAPLAFTTSKVEGSTYLDATLPGLGQLEIR